MVGTAFAFPPQDFFDGSAAQLETLWPWHVALDGRPYLIDITQYETGGSDPFRDSQDNSSSPGDQSLAFGGIWKRTITDWAYGAGQDYQDERTSEYARFWDSDGIDWSTPNQASLLADCVQIYPGLEHLLTVGSYVYGWAQGDTTVVYSASVGTGSVSFQGVTGAPAADVTGMATDGQRVFVAFGSSGVYKTTAGGASMSSYDVGPAENLWWANGRLFSSYAQTLYEVTGDGTPTVLLAHPNTSFVWAAATGGPGAVFAAGAAGVQSVIYAITYDAATGDLNVPVPAASLPVGETVTALGEYLGLILIGTSEGVRLGQADADGRIIFGPLVETGTAVNGFASWGPHVWFGWSDKDADSTGIGRLDLARFAGALTPAYGADLMVPGPGTVTSVIAFRGDPYWAAAGLGMYGPEYGGDRRASGTLTSGWLTYGTAEEKSSALFGIRAAPIDGAVSATVECEDGTEVAVGRWETGSRGTDTDVFAGGKRGRKFRIRLTLERDELDFTQGPVVEAWSLRAGIAPQPMREWIVPILLFDQQDVNGTLLSMDPLAEWSHLQELERSRDLVIYQEGQLLHLVRVRTVTIARGGVRAWNHNQSFFNATALVRLTEVGI